MERQLKERLIGAAVLMAAAEIMVGMFSGAGTRPKQSTEVAAASAGPLKTYRIELQSARPAVAQEPAPVTVPAERPQDELLPAASGIPQPVSANSSSAAVGPATNPVSEPAPVKAEAPARPIAPSAKPVAGNWVVQVGSFAAQDKAQQIAASLKAQGNPAYIGSVTVGNKTLYRVRVGATTERSAAEATLQKLKPAYPGASVVPANR